MPSDRPNTPPPDELAAVRDEIRRLESREADLKQILIANPDVRMGANWLAEIKDIVTNRVDIKELRAMHPDVVEEYTHALKSIRIELSAIDPDTGEIIHARRARQEASG